MHWNGIQKTYLLSYCASKSEQAENSLVLPKQGCMHSLAVARGECKSSAASEKHYCVKQFTDASLFFRMDPKKQAKLKSFTYTPPSRDEHPFNIAVGLFRGHQVTKRDTRRKRGQVTTNVSTSIQQHISLVADFLVCYIHKLMLRPLDMHCVNSLYLPISAYDHQAKEESLC